MAVQPDLFDGETQVKVPAALVIEGDTLRSLGPRIPQALGLEGETKRIKAKLSPADAVISSPPYPDKAERYPNTPRDLWSLKRWPQTMAALTVELLDTVTPWVVWVVADTVRQNREYPCTDKLRVLLHEEHDVACETPAIWFKNSPPSRMLAGGAQAHWVPTYERILVFKRPDARFWWEENAPKKKYTAGGKFRQRNAKGKRVVGSDYPQGDRARPRNLFVMPPDEQPTAAPGALVRAKIGGGHMGTGGKLDNAVVSQGRAPFPLLLAAQLVQAYVPPDGVVFDPFTGTATTHLAAMLRGRKSVGLEIDPEQARQAKIRLETAASSYQAHCRQLRDKLKALLG